MLFGGGPDHLDVEISQKGRYVIEPDLQFVLYPVLVLLLRRLPTSCLDGGTQTSFFLREQFGADAVLVVQIQELAPLVRQCPQCLRRSCPSVPAGPSGLRPAPGGQYPWLVPARAWGFDSPRLGEPPDPASAPPTGTTGAVGSSHDCHNLGIVAEMGLKGSQ